MATLRLGGRLIPTSYTLANATTCEENKMTTWDAAAGKEKNRQVVEDFRKSGGRLEGRELVLLTTTGAKSGKPHTTPLMYLAEGDEIYVIASKGGAPASPAWYYNLVAHPTV